ncbi:MAG TPA: hypothetical protein VN047_09505 [Sphingopyxis sp.]|uniref:hypothetical protein n=1 Tax=Sphingopyxis sp. TaxID=1908224 RepID=UPI002D12AA78|nr:hypothetical protein [Sphingopyxis sp.]HWW57114.1 hypothetical protein [Sphingopyxis sp.]
MLGASASGGGSFGIENSPKSVSAALQAAFSSAETGATIARTQTVTMLREMMFRTCERYLSGAISRDELPIVAVRDQRVMVSILAIEQLTGSITPRAVSIAAGGSASTGYNPTEMVKLLVAGQTELKTAEEEVAAKVKKLAEADVPAGNCAALRQKKAAGTPALAADETTRLTACDDAQGALDKSKTARDLAQARYDDLVRGSRSGLGLSSASTTGMADFADDDARADAVAAVALTVEKIVGNTFAQDETQLFCIRTISNPDAPGAIQQQCLNYLMTRVAADEAALARQYGLTPAVVRSSFDDGTRIGQNRALLVRAIMTCFARPDQGAPFKSGLTADAVLAPTADALLAAAREGEPALTDYLFDQDADYEQRVRQIVATHCTAGN